MAKRVPRYTDEFRAGAVLMLEGAGWPETVGAVTRVARHLSIPRQTLQRWAHGQQNPPPPEMVRELKRDIIAMLDDIIYGAASEVKRRIDDNELDEVSIPQLMTAVGIGVEKRQLLDGKPTGRTENTLDIGISLVDYRRDLNSGE